MFSRKESRSEVDRTLRCALCSLPLAINFSLTLLLLLLFVCFLLRHVRILRVLCVYSTANKDI